MNHKSNCVFVINPIYDTTENKPNHRRDAKYLYQKTSTDHEMIIDKIEAMFFRIEDNNNLNNKNKIIYNYLIIEEIHHCYYEKNVA